MDEVGNAMEEAEYDPLEVVTTLKINLRDAFADRSFLLASLQHNVRREQPLFSRVLAKHIRFALQWMYTTDRRDLVEHIEDDDTLRILAIAVLFGLDDLADVCVTRYTKSQISIDTIMRDIEHICQLPHDHDAYLRLKNAAVLLLLRRGPENPKSLAALPVDYMTDVLGADALLVGSECERYCLLRQVFVEYVQSVDKLSWSPTVPPSAIITVNADNVRSRKRKRIPSEELADGFSLMSHERGKARRILTGCTFSATAPFETLVSQASSAGITDKAEVLTSLLRTSVDYRCMTFEQLLKVRQDLLVDESVVLKALWQREELERLLYPSTAIGSLCSSESRPSSSPTSSYTLDERFAAPDERCDADSSKELEQQLKTILPEFPKFRFRFSVPMTCPDNDSTWSIDHGEGMSALSQHKESHELPAGLGSSIDNPIVIYDSQSDSNIFESARRLPQRNIRKRTFYSRTVTAMSTKYRVKVDAQIIPRNLVEFQGEDDDDGPESSENEEEDVLLCRFEVQRVRSESSNTICSQQAAKLQRDTQTRYTIYYLNRHERLWETHIVNTEQTESKEAGDLPYMGPTLIYGNIKDGMTFDTMVTLEPYYIHDAKDYLLQNEIQ